MRTSTLACLAVLLALATPAYGFSDLDFTLDFNTGSGSSTSLNPDADSCLPPNCVLFTGTLLDTDTDLSYIYLTDISVAFSSNPPTGALTLDNTFYDVVPGVLSGDPNYATDGLSNPPDIYSGPIFGIDIAPGTSLGAYTGTVTVDAIGGTFDPDYQGFSVIQDITVQVIAPEPAAGCLALLGLAVFSAWGWRKHKWRTSESSR